MGWAELAPGRRVTFTRVIFFCRLSASVAITPGSYRSI